MTPAVRIPAPHLLLTALLLGLAGALVVRAHSIMPAAAAALLTVAGALLGPRRVVAIALALFCAGWWWGSLRLDGLDGSRLAQEIGRTGPALLEVTGPARRSTFAVRLPVRVREFDGDAEGEAARLELPPGRAPPQGALIEVVASIRAPRPPQDGSSFDERTYLSRQGVHAVLRASGFRLVGHRGGMGHVADVLRARIARTLGPGLGGEKRAVVEGLVLGEDEGLSDDLRASFRAAGLYHLLAVSGQNVAYVITGSLLLAWLVGFPRWAGQIAALASLGGYVLAVGWQPSVVRAGIAGALASLAWLTSRPTDRWYFLLAGAAVLLAVNPYTLLDAGFQLSFAAVAAIFLAVPRLARTLEGYPVPSRFGAVLAVSAGCGIATAPILWLQFGAVPVYSVLANALAEPVVAPLLGFGLVCSALDPVLPSAAAALAWINGWLAAYLAWCARTVGALPGAQARSGIALAALAVVVICMFLVARLPKRRRRRAWAVAAAVGVLVVGGWTLWPAADPPPPPAGLRLTVLDVGQGDSILLQVAQGAVLVDEGPPEANVARQLERLGVHRLAALVVTHPHRDHVGGAPAVLRAMPVGFVLDPREPTDSYDERAALDEARRDHVPVVAARDGRVYSLGRLRLRVLWPDGGGVRGEDPHHHAVVLLASYGRFDALLTADAESEVTLPLRPPPVEFLKVAHHGSSDQGLPDLLHLLRPQVAAISVGAHNDYGHPAPSTVAALGADTGLAVYRTDLDGRIVVESDGRRYSVRTER